MTDEEIWRRTKALCRSLGLHRANPCEECEEIRVFIASAVQVEGEVKERALESVTLCNCPGPCNAHGCILKESLRLKAEVERLNSLFLGEKAALKQTIETSRKQREGLNLQVIEYQAALRKVDGCCNCLKSVERFKPLSRGTPEPKCEDCNQERSTCECVENRNGEKGSCGVFVVGAGECVADKPCKAHPVAANRSGACVICGYQTEWKVDALVSGRCGNCYTRLMNGMEKRDGDCR